MSGRARRGRGSLGNASSRFDRHAREAARDADCDDVDAPATQLFVDTAKTVITCNDSPDIPFSRSINPYRGCEHGCSYCYARPSHAYLGLSPGLDFETRIAYKADAAARLREELARPSYRCQPIALGTNTDAYQPVERKLRVTRTIVETLWECRHPFTLVTKSALVERDIDLLADMARDNLVQAFFSVTTLDAELARRMEPRAAAPARRLEAVRRLADAGVPVGVLCAPLIPALNDHEMEKILAAARAAGATSAAYTVLRLPHELGELFPEWLQAHYPGRAAHVLAVLRQLRGGALYDSGFATRMKGSGVVAEMYAQRFRVACARLALNERTIDLDCSRFVPPRPPTPQLALF